MRSIHFCNVYVLIVVLLSAARLPAQPTVNFLYTPCRDLGEQPQGSRQVQMALSGSRPGAAFGVRQLLAS